MIPRIRRKPEFRVSDHETLFLDYYKRLLGWALQLTGGSRSRAEDLVHDVYIQFVLSSPELHLINNLDGYLRRMLTNLFVTQQRKAAQMQNISFNMADFDSAEIGLRAIDFQARWQAQESLLQICHYACVRKESSRAGSVLILRFFYDYSPSEIAAVIASPRRAVDDWLHLARREAKLHLDSPERLKFMSREQESPIKFNPFSSTSADNLMHEMRASIAGSRQGDCLSETQLQMLYRGDEGKQIDCATLGHIVSCLNCLDEVNCLLGLPPLAARTAPGTSGSDDDGPGTNGTLGQSDLRGGRDAAGPAQEFIVQFRRRLRQVVEHRPDELHISADGFHIGSLKLGSELNELQLDIREQPPVESLQVYSERGVLLSHFDVGPHQPGNAEQKTHVELSDERTLDLILDTSDWGQSVRIIYHDPLLRESSTDVPSDEEAGELRLIQPAPERITKRFWRRLSALNLWKRSDQEIFAPSIFTEQSRHSSHSPFWRRPIFVTSLLSIVLLAALVYLWRPATSPVNAAGLLERAKAAEDKLDGNRSLVQHRMLDLEERNPIDGRIIARRRIETWNSAAHGIKARRLYDEKNLLIAGQWRKADGTTAFYRRGAKPQSQPAPVLETIDPDTIWLFDLSAGNFSALAKRVETATTEETSQTYVIRYQPPESSQVVKATLMLSKYDLHTIEQVLQLQQARETREFRFSEASYKQLPVSEVSPAVFQPEIELIGKNSSTERAIAVPTLSSASSTPAMATVDLEIEVIRLLNQANAFLGEQLSVTRTPEGRLLIEGIIDTDERKRELVQALAPVSNNRAVTIKIETPAEAAARVAQQQSHSSVNQIVISEVQVTSKYPPAYSELRRYFTERGTPNDRIDQTIDKFADTALSRSRRALQHARAMKQIASRFAPEELDKLDQQTLAQWQAMIREHAQAFEHEAAILRQTLNPIFFPALYANEAEIEAEPINHTTLGRTIERLFDDWSSIDENVRQSFSVGPNDPATIPIKLPQFWRMLLNAERVADSLRHQ